MHALQLIAFATLASAVTIHLAGDSTMALGGGGGSTQGWGVEFPQYVTLPVVNHAVAGTSARSYTDKGLFTTLISQVKSGDYVIIEFGHNDATAHPDNGNQDAVGDGYNITGTVTTANGTTLVVHSFAYYIENAINAIKAKGATPITSTQTPDNIWTGSSIGAGGRFVQYCTTIAKDTSIVEVDHYAYVAQAYNKLGQTQVTTFYPMDHLHTSAAGATVVAQAFVRGLLCGNSTLKGFVNAAGKAVPNGCI